MPLDSANRCPSCHCADLRVTHTQHISLKWAGINKIRVKRRRVCRYCGYVTNTFELTEEEMIKVERQIDTQENQEQ